MITGIELKNQFYSGIKEREIENIFCGYLRRPGVSVTKEKMGAGTTDGVIRRYDHGELISWALNETKRDVGITSVWYRRAWLQSFMYLGNAYFDAWRDLEVDKFLGITLNSARYFSIIHKAEVDKAMKELESLWGRYYKVLPSVAYHVPELYDWVKSLDIEVEEYTITPSFVLDPVIDNFYKIAV